jgi:hypothetical protein
LSRYTINEFFYFFQLFFRQEKAVFSFISLIFLPGTIIHELAHYLMATILMLKVREVKILPELQDNYIRLGSVSYEKKDVFRSIIVGLAPLFIILVFFGVIARFGIFPSTSIIINILLAYVIFSVSSSMFSSAKDLQDLVFVIPLLIIIAGIIYVSGIKVEILLSSKAADILTSFISSVNSYLLLSVIINISLIFILKSIRVIIKKQ